MRYVVIGRPSAGHPSKRFAWSTRNSNGNLADDGTRTYEWDALNRLKKVYKTPSSPVLIGEYTYDALGRRIRKVVTNNGLSGNITNGTTDFLYSGGRSQCCEERDGSNNPEKQYVWGIYIDELLQQKNDISGTPADQYPLQDTLYRTVALTDDSGSIIEAYDTDAYSNTLIFTAAGTGGDWWADDATQGDESTCDFIFTGRRYDTESEIYFYRARYYDANLGRFLSRDPIVSVATLSLYEYAYDNTLVFVDPFGLQSGIAEAQAVESGFYDDTSPKRTGIMTFTFISEKEIEDDWVLPGRTIRGGTLDDMIDAVKKKMKDDGTCCVKVIQLDAHSGVPGMAQISDDFTIFATTDEELSGERKVAPRSVDRTKAKFKKLRELTDLICDGGTLEIVQCMSGKGVEGDELRKLLEDQSGNRIRIKLYTGNVHWQTYAYITPSFPVPDKLTVQNPKNKSR